MIHSLLAAMQKESVSRDAQEAAEEYLKNSEQIRALENRQLQLIQLIKSLFDQQYGNATQYSLLPSGELHNQGSMPKRQT